MVTVDNIVEIGFIPVKINKFSASTFHMTYKKHVSEIIINLRTGAYTIKFNDEEVSKGEVSSIEQLEEKLQGIDGED